ncbi:MAG: hypothetical protein EOO29_51750 [Comamonadaceae bacterium]|nr:MAG: hypothetical protein EOO29_51750 [Comamonadaceae bacterium]
MSRWGDGSLRPRIGSVVKGTAMNVDIEKWQSATVLLTVALVVIGLLYAAWHIAAQRRRSARLIAAARVRSGHIPGDLPTVRTGLTAFGDLGFDSAPQALAANDSGDCTVVDEQPLIRIRYVDPAIARKIDATLQVQHLDVQKRVVIGYCDLPADVRRIPLRSIVAARIADSGQRFDVDTWVDAVRVARRRRGMMG